MRKHSGLYSRCDAQTLRTGRGYHNNLVLALVSSDLALLQEVGCSLNSTFAEETLQSQNYSVICVRLFTEILQIGRSMRDLGAHSDSAGDCALRQEFTPIDSCGK
jgi:hypothetical protein